MTRPTPLVDAAAFRGWEHPDYLAVSADFARQLERSREELREQFRKRVEHEDAIKARLERSNAELVLGLMEAHNALDRAYDCLEDRFCNEAMLICGAGASAALKALCNAGVDHG